jgi:hypothetical protein
MAKKTIAKENPVADALRKLKEEESELLGKLKFVQEAISALENVLDKTGKKSNSSSGAKGNGVDHLIAEENGQEASEAFQ